VNGCGFPNDDSYYNPTHQENTMTDNIQTLTEAGYPLQLHYVSDIDCPFVLAAGDITVVGFDDRDLAARTLQDADSLIVQIDANGTSVIHDGEELSHSTYSPFLAVMEAVQKIATSGRQWAFQTLDLSPAEINEDAGAYEEEYDRGAVVREDADGFLLTTRGGEIRFTDQEDALDAAGLLTLAVSGHNRRQEA
jgi:hypothetical protein